MSFIPHNEDDILAILDAHFPVDHAGLLLGRGDDCAVIRSGGPWAVTCDVFLENAHFRRHYFTPAEIGHKALAVNLSDLAAQGARPTGFVLGLTLTGREDGDWLHAFAGGMARVAAKYGIALAGGDLAKSPCLHVSITAWGELDHNPGCGLRRARLREGDCIFVVGPLGLARTGLHLLEAAPAEQDVVHVREQWPAACAQHLRPEPLVEPGVHIARLAGRYADKSFSLMDVSDGLARDLPRLLGTAKTGFGAALELTPDRLPAEVVRYAAMQGLDAASFAYQGGEDYALAGTCPPEAWPLLQNELGPQVYRLGTVTRQAITLNGMVQPGGGFDHFG